MFGISGWELLFLMIIALVVVGPKELPQLMRMIGQWTGRARAMVREFQASFDEMARQAELDEIKKEVGDIAGGKELQDLKKQINESVDNMVDPPKPINTQEGYRPPTEDGDETSDTADATAAQPKPSQQTGTTG